MHEKKIEEVFKELKTSKEGLTEKEAEKRQNPSCCQSRG